MKYLFLALLFVGLANLQSCSPKTPDCTGESGHVKDLTGLDGCTLVIELDSGKTLEIVSLPAGIEIEAGQPVCIQYEVRNDIASICMVGTMADITSLEFL